MQNTKILMIGYVKNSKIVLDKNETKKKREKECNIYLLLKQLKMVLFQ